MSKLTEDDKNMICYFIQERGNIERWSDWEKKKEQVKKEYPFLIKGLDMKKDGEELIRLVIKDISDTI